ncbi:MAG: pyrimidine dimer DNA glycosylase/endonuclease V [Candidatus Micrarchaeia archaeon]
MVRINLIPPSKLSDQHLIAEYNEILMLLGHIRKYPEPNNVPIEFTLGKGHVTFFKDKLGYLVKRHNELSKEMRNRGFKPKKRISLSGFPKNLIKEWKPSKKDELIVKRRIEEKIRSKPGFYRYFGKKRPVSFFIRKLREA